MAGAAGAAGATVATTPKACGGNVAPAGGGWTATAVPPLATIALLRSPTYAPDRIYATDGHGTLVRSDDDGCSWSDISPTPPTLAGLTQAPESVTITSIAAPSSATSEGYLYIGADVTPTDKLPLSLPAQPYVYASNTGGRPDIASGSGNGLPPVGHVQEVAASDLAPRIVYAMITGAGSNSGLWVSNDGAASWTGPLATDTSLADLRVDPDVANWIYAVEPGTGLMLSRNGGRTFAPAPQTDPDVASFAAASGSGGVQLAQGHGSDGIVEVSTDSGRSWRAVMVFAQTAHDVAIGATVPVVAAYDDKKLSIVQVGRCGTLPLAFTPGVGTPADGSLQMSAPTGVGLALTGVSRDGRHILRAVYNPLTCLPAPASLTPIHLLPQVTVKQFPSVLSADTAKVRLPSGGAVRGPRIELPAGASADVPYSLLLPRTPSPVDLMFLVDTTDSTDQMIDGVRQGLQTVVNELAGTGLDVRFGVGDFKDYPGTTGGGGEDGDYPYRLRRAIGPVDLSLQHAMALLHSGGGGDQAESDLAALYYSTLGTGVKRGRHWLVRPGAAGYRPGSLRLAMLATDEMFHTEPDYPGPHWQQTVDALVAHGVHQIGLAVESQGQGGKPQPGLFDSAADQRRMARATGAIAPAGGVDCDGDGVTDIPAGDPLVCTIAKPADSRVTVSTVTGGPKVTVGSPPPPVHLAPLVVQLASSIPDLRPVGLMVAGAPRGAAKVVSPRPVAPVVNLRVDNALSYVVRYTCPTSATPHTWPLTVTAHAGARPVSSTRTTLVCGAAPAPGIVPAAVVALPAAVAPGTPPNPPPNVNANANPNPAVNPNAGFAQQDEEQPQLALAESDQGLEDEPGTSLAMSRRSSDAQAAWMLGAAGLMTAGAAAYATRSRWRTARQPW
jgi:hypothetical protein